MKHLKTAIPFILSLLCSFLESYAQTIKENSTINTINKKDDYSIIDSLNGQDYIAFNNSDSVLCVIRRNKESLSLESLFPEYKEIKIIANSEGRYLLCRKTDKSSYIYDYKLKKEYPTIYHNERKHYDSLVYLGLRTKEPIFHDYQSDMFGLNGFYAGLNAEESGLNTDSLYNDKVSIYNEYIGKVFVPLAEIPIGHFVCFDLDNYTETLNYQIPINNSENSDSINETSFYISIPKLNNLDNIKENILYWIADCYAVSKGEYFICDIRNIKDEKSLIESIINYFNNNLTSNESIHETFLVCPLYKSNEYASFFIEYSRHSEAEGDVECAFAATFDIRQGIRLTLSDIVNEEGKEYIYNYLRDHYYRDLNISFFRMPVAIDKEGLKFFMGERESSFEFVTSILNSVNNYGLEDYIDALKTPFIPYQNIESYLRINISDTCETITDHLNYCFKPLENIVNSFNPHKTQHKIDTYSRFIDDTYFENINNSYNRHYAKSIQNEKPELSANIYERLLEEFQTTAADNSIRNNYYYSVFLTANNYYKKEEYDKADSICNYLLNEMPINTTRPLSTNYSFYILFNKIISEPNLQNFNPNTSIYDYSTDEGFNVHIDALILLSKIRKKQNDSKGEREYAILSTDLIIPYLQSKIFSISRELRTGLWQHYRNWLLFDLVEIAVHSRENQITSSAYGALLFGKGLLLNSEVSLMKHILNGTNEEAKILLSEYNKIKADIEKYRRIGRLDKCNELSYQLNDIHKSLTYNVDYSNYIEKQKVSLNQVDSCLHNDEIAIEFTDLPNKQDTTYYAFVLCPNDTTPKIVKLCSNGDLRNTSKNDISNGNLYNVIWGNLEDYLTATKTIFFSPSGILNTLPIESAIDIYTNQRVNSIYNIYRLSSTREIAVARDTAFNHQSGDYHYGLLVGGLNYDNDRYNTKQKSFTEDNNEPLFREGLKINKVDYLPATKKEIECIEPLMYHIENVKKVGVLTNDKGTEPAFKYYSQYPISLLHIATHGFYINDDNYSRLDKNNYFSIIGRNYRDIEEKGLIRSGLVFAGVNKVLKKNKKISSNNDGILTAMEISSLDLHGVDLAILSACQTGTGIISNDGVIGIQRGFKKAGVNSILMSLWSVNDESTSIFMTKFYEALAKYNDKQQALNEAQNYLIVNTKYKDPHYWAAFVLLDGIR